MKKSIDTGFQSFSSEMHNFFSELKNNNNRQWFEINKPRYEKYVKDAAKAFVSAVGMAFAGERLPYIADPKRSTFRIYRDIRFSANKEPYKTNLGIYFPYIPEKSDDRRDNWLGIYFHYSPEESFFAAGIHAPESPELKAIRRRIAEDWQYFDELLKDRKIRGEMRQMWDSGKLKRVPPGFPSDHPAGEFLKMKGFTLFDNLDYDIVFSDKLIPIICKKARVVLPFMEFLNEAILEK
ncbi:MAG: DUF2461 domain-containing protein [Candidatus Kapabacteria bacterium]|nr:DUF2461 domain-containing protein [Candidatus Kapabacteria bacterium]